MQRHYRLMYRLGLMPWDQDRIPDEVASIVSGRAALPPGVALDIGCGTGRHSAYLAEHGWNVTAVDVSSRAIELARRRSAAVHWYVVGLGEPSMGSVIDALSGQASLVLDVGCLHGLDAAGRHGWERCVRQVSSPGTHIVLRAVEPRLTRSITPRGIGRDEVSILLGPEWRQVDGGATDWAHYVRHGSSASR